MTRILVNYRTLMLFEESELVRILERELARLESVRASKLASRHDKTLRIVRLLLTTHIPL